MADNDNPSMNNAVSFEQQREQEQPQQVDNEDDNDDNNDPNPPPRKKGIRFPDRQSRIEEVRRISRLSNYALEEVIAMWGDTEEHALQKMELKEAVSDIVQGRRNSDNLTFSAMGLTDKFGNRKVEKKQARMESWEAVLDEQYLQEQDGIRNDELLAGVYEGTTHDAKEKALQEALQLERDVKAMMLNPSSNDDNETEED
jgi:hypothetical protein